MVRTVYTAQRRSLSFRCTYHRTVNVTPARKYTKTTHLYSLLATTTSLPKCFCENRWHAELCTALHHSWFTAFQAQGCIKVRFGSWNVTRRQSANNRCWRLKTSCTKFLKEIMPKASRVRRSVCSLRRQSERETHIWLHYGEIKTTHHKPQP